MFDFLTIFTQNRLRNSMLASNSMQAKHVLEVASFPSYRNHWGSTTEAILLSMVYGLHV